MKSNNAYCTIRQRPVHFQIPLSGDVFSILPVLDETEIPLLLDLAAKSNFITYKCYCVTYNKL